MSPRLRLMTAGRCSHPECFIIRGGGFRAVDLPAGFALIDHPSLGPTLFDTGYSPRFLQETSRYPDRLYAMVTPAIIRPEETARAQLERLGIGADDVRLVILSHLHGDHIAGMADFPKARYLFSRPELDSVSRKRGVSRLLAAFLPGLLPSDFEERATPLDPSGAKPLPSELAPFERGVDLAGDGSMFAVELPGHTLGHFGLFVAGPGSRWTLLAADACWLGRGYRENLMPSAFVRGIFSSWSKAKRTVAMLHELHRRRPDVFIVPSHCVDSQAAASRAWESA